MASGLVTTLVGGGLALAGTAVGAFLTQWLGRRGLTEQRAYEEKLRERERLLDEREKLLSLDPNEATVARKMLLKGGALLNRSSLGDLRLDRKQELFFGCFPGASSVLMADGSPRRISVLQKGGLIRTYNYNTHTESQAPVNAVIADVGKQLVNVSNWIVSTPRQQIFCDGRFEAAEFVRLGAVLVSSEHKSLAVGSVELVETEGQVYSLALDEDAGYFVKTPGAEHFVLVREAVTGKL
jgi:hypothetical protein